MSILSLCSGYGGLDMAIDDEVTAYAENDKHASKVMGHHLPGAPNLGDITDIDWGIVDYFGVRDVDWITGGFPCQPFSLAGKRQGEADARHLWPHIAEAVRVVQPRHVFLENVRSLLTLGFGSVAGDLAGLGYNFRWGVVRASDAGAPHGRARVFILASHADCVGDVRIWNTRTSRRFEPTHRRQTATDSNCLGLQGPEAAAGQDSQREAEARFGPSDRRHSSGSLMWGEYWPAVERWENLMGRQAPWPKSMSTAGKPHLSAEFTEWMMGLPAGHVTDVPGLAWSHQIKILGNGVVPQQARLALELLS